MLNAPGWKNLQASKTRKAKRENEERLGFAFCTLHFALTYDFTIQ
jgi:hypothetical protein